MSNAVRASGLAPRALGLTVVLSLILSALPAALADGHPWQEGVWYEIFVRSFNDSDSDGVGDLQGVIRKLPYLSELGVSGIWLMPIHPSPSYHGYDVTDYTDINPDYGTLDDMKELLAAAHALGIRVIMDFVPNHSSSQHPWFLASAAGDPAYRDYYVWHSAPPDWRGTRGGSAWHPSPTGAAEHYLGLFSPGMPDLNHRNPQVVEEFKQIARFWLELGVDGFRVDAIQHMIESDSGQISNTPETYEWVREFQAFMHEEAPHAFLVGETWTEMPAIIRYHESAQLDMSFDYPLWRVLLAAIQGRSAADLGDVVAQAEQLYPEDAVRGTFISNHDQTRPATLLSFPRRDEQRMKLAAGLLLTLPGTPFLYYGDEIGMPDGPGSFDVEKRTPMRWTEPTAGGQFGFTTGAPWTDPGEVPAGVSVEAQQADPGSVWHAYRRLIALRGALPALHSGDFTLLDAGARAVLAAQRSYADERVLLLANLSTRAVPVNLAALGVQPDAVTVVHAPLEADEAAPLPLGAELELGALSLLVLELR